MYYNTINPNFNTEERVFPIFPFLLGGLAGGALVGVSRPRPVYVNPPQYTQQPQNYPMYSGTPYTPYPPYNPYGGYYNYQSGGYY